jgi:cytochrome b
MSMMHRLRLYHATLAALVIVAYISGEWGAIHLWLGYGIAVVIVFRLLLVLTGAPQLGLARFYPQFADLKLDSIFTNPLISRSLLLGIAVCLIGATLTGFGLDKGRGLGMAQGQIASPAYADDDGEHGNRGGDRKGNKGLEEAHELFSNLLMLLVACHVTYLLAFKLPIARFMLFAEAKKASPPPTRKTEG